MPVPVGALFCTLAVLALTWASLAFAAAREYPIGKAVASLGDRGKVQVAEKGQVLISDVRLWLAGPQWKSTDTRAGRLVQTGVHGPETWTTFELTEPVSGGKWQVVLKTQAMPDGLHLSYLARPQQDMTVNELSIIFELPIAQWKGRKVALWPVSELTLPEELPARYHLASAYCTAVVLARDTGRLVLRLDEPARCMVQDSRKFKGDSYEVFVSVIPTGHTKVKAGDEYVGGVTIMPDDKASYASLTPSGYRAQGPLKIKGVRASALRVPCFSRLELAVDLSATYDNPFDPNQIDLRAIFQTPGGERKEVPAFYWADYQRRQAGKGVILVPLGRGGWRVRFTPCEVGHYSFRLVARDRTGATTEWGPGTFDALPSKAHGFVRRSQDPHYFCFDDGTPYFAVGENLCWYSSAQRTADYDRWLARLQAAGANYIRLWMPRWAFGIEADQVGVYRMDRAWELDYVLDQCQQRGIYVKLCLENFRRFDDGQNPYDRRNGGPCKTVRDFFEKPEARALFKQRLRYIVARWSYSPALMAWELWNEVNCVQGYGEYRDVVRDWTVEICRYLREIDPNQHLTVTSLGSSQYDDKLWALPEMDFAQMHGYYGWSGYDETRDMAAFIPHWLKKIDHFGKPYLFAEFGIIREKPEPRELCDRDREGVHLHNGLWSAALSGAAGGAMLWWWDSYVDPMNLYSRFASLATFARDVPWTDAELQPTRLQASPEGLRVLALRGPRTLLFWAQNPAHTWWKVV
ncbi:MAG: DUF5060 domain-containing protein, partial [Armatimonadetes bacterium]|nr:DUF5060 domain-containing protein [Armatimonadota bacterium]